MSDTRYQILDFEYWLGGLIMAGMSYKDLEIYKLARSLSIESHHISLKLPKFELYEEGSQLRRASKSVVANIVEGFSRRRYKNEFIKFLVYAMASCDETQEHLSLIFDTGSLADKETYDNLQKKYNELGKMLNGFIKKVDSDHKSKQ